MAGIKVSIVIPVYNREAIISETLESAIHQTYPNIEIIVVDNCSTDKTFDVVEQYAKNDIRIKLFRNGANLGPVRNWVECLKHVTGEYAKILWSDDKISPQFIEKCLKLFDDDTAFVVTATQIFDETGPLRIEYLNNSDTMPVKDYIRTVILGGRCILPNSPGCILIRTVDLKDSLVIDVPNSDKLNFNRYGAGNDLLIMLKTAVKYKNVKFVSTVESYFRGHKGSLSCSNDLVIYYIWAKTCFLNEYGDANINFRFKIRLFIKQLRNKEYSNVCHSLKYRLSMSGFIEELLYASIKIIKFITSKRHLF
jgi:glycosyltransferase involved in cell wall biosynthesis